MSSDEYNFNVVQPVRISPVLFSYGLVVYGYSPMTVTPNFEHPL
jgi:hypothetical protein